MAPLIVLCTVALFARAAGALGIRRLASWPAAVRLALAAMFCFTAIAHFAPMRTGEPATPLVPRLLLQLLFIGLLWWAGWRHAEEPAPGPATGTAASTDG